MESKFFQTDLGTIRYWVSRMQPQMPWLVFLPGLSADHTLFEKQLAYFSSRYNCFVWDAPAHGLSRPFQLSFTMWDLADYLYEIFEAEGIVSPVLIGQSLGGYISQVYMDKYPGAVSGFVSIDSCPMSRKYYSSWELALLKKTKGMYMSIPWKLLLEGGIAGTSTTKYGRDLMRRCWSVYEKEEYCILADHGGFHRQNFAGCGHIGAAGRGQRLFGYRVLYPPLGGRAGGCGHLRHRQRAGKPAAGQLYVYGHRHHPAGLRPRAEYDPERSFGHRARHPTEYPGVLVPSGYVLERAQIQTV